MLDYREILPAPEWAGAIECFWSMRGGDETTPHRVLPDGCADLLLTGRALDAVGPMTTFRDHVVPAGRELFGVRFRPGRWTGMLGVPGDRIVDAVVPLEDLWGSRARALLDRIVDARSPEERARAIEAALPHPVEPGPVERAIAFLQQAAGCASVEELADEAGLSARQFRRVCLEKTGLTPKLLARVLRFREAAARVHAAQSAVALALDCGYYDQAHLIRDFREFAGRTARQNVASGGALAP
jgi:AraC-like DNA-binding protein